MARSDYSTMYPVIKAAQNDADIEYIVFCGGMHLVPAFGETYKQLLEDDIEIAEKINDTHEFYEQKHGETGALDTEAAARAQQPSATPAPPTPPPPTPPAGEFPSQAFTDGQTNNDQPPTPPIAQ